MNESSSSTSISAPVNASSLLANRRERLLKSKSRRTLVPVNSQRSLGLGASQRSLQSLSTSSIHYIHNEDDDDNDDGNVKVEVEIPDMSELMNLSFSSIPRRDLPRGESFRSRCSSRSGGQRSLAALADRHTPKTFSGDSFASDSVSSRCPPRQSRRDQMELPPMVVSSEEFSDEESDAASR